jgi:D-alanyl-D-alanine dipeptidase
MRSGFLHIALYMLCLANVQAQHKPHVLSVADYTTQIKTAPDKRLVEITKAVPAIKLDIKYATTDNFMHRVMYAQARAFARAPLVEALKAIQAELKLKGLGLKIYDAYRPYAVTVAFYQMTPDTNFVADPKYGSKHNRGCAIDLSIINLKTGKELNMPTPFDSFKRQAASDYEGLPPEQLQNRELLKAVMQAHGFAALRTEWWHFDFIGWQQYELLDVPFEKL